MKTIAFFNNKGGVGKSTTAINIANAMSRSGNNVIVVDVDAQRNSYRFFTDKPGNDYSGETRYNGISIMFAKIFNKLPGDFDFTILDIPPSLNQTATHFLKQCDYVFVPIELGTFSIQGIAKVTEHIASTGTRFGGGFINKFDRDNPSDHKLEEELRKNLGAKILATRIPSSRVIKNSISYRQTAFEYSPKSKAARTYTELSREIVNICKGGNDNA